MSECSHKPFESFAAAMHAVHLAQHQTGKVLRARSCPGCGQWRVVRAGRKQRRPVYRNRSRRVA